MLIDTAEGSDRALAIVPVLPSSQADDGSLEYRKDEFSRLAQSCECVLLESSLVSIRRPSAGLLFGKGQVEDIATSVKSQHATVVFVDHALSPVQQRNLETAWNAKVVDRTGLILEIFAARASTREGALQVELASMNYQISRLVRSWTHLERQRGGHGFLGGPGERQIELDRRMIHQRIDVIKKELVKVRKRRGTQRFSRQQSDISTAVLVGYTNAGKSTLFNVLSGADIYTADQLFATLDPTIRQVALSDDKIILLSDTVGFLQDLPHELVDAFRATLEEVLEADLILHVRDMSDPQAEMQSDTVMSTLKGIGLSEDASVVEVWNKADLMPGMKSIVTEDIAGSRCVVSAKTGEGLDAFREVLANWLSRQWVELDLSIDPADGKRLAACYAYGEVLSQRMDGQTMHLQVKVPSRYVSRLSGD